MLYGFRSSFFPFFSSPWRQTLGCLAKQRPLLKNILSSFFILRLLISSILRGKTLDAHSRKDRPSLKKKKSLVLCILLFASLSSLAFLEAEDGFPFLLSITRQMNLILELNAYSRSCINHFLSFQT